MGEEDEEEEEDKDKEYENYDEEEYEDDDEEYEDDDEEEEEFVAAVQAPCSAQATASVQAATSVQAASAHVVQNYNQQRENLASNFIGSTSYLALYYEPPLGPFSEYVVLCTICFI